MKLAPNPTEPGNLKIVKHRTRKLIQKLNKRCSLLISRAPFFVMIELFIKRMQLVKSLLQSMNEGKGDLTKEELLEFLSPQFAKW
jgi:hypothetical protein